MIRYVVQEVKGLLFTEVSRPYQARKNLAKKLSWSNLTTAKRQIRIGAFRGELALVLGTTKQDF
ncbi:hypothetical protein N7507_003166 [Penicillium longicatenatum]|nr:hypothetical protein N7507_003166 [Penicillium longicatenatum]